MIEEDNMLDRIDNPGRSISESELDEVSSAIGLDFPADYKNFLLKYNGGSPDPDAITIKEHEEEVGTVQLFFGIDREIESSCLKWVYDELRDRIPDSYLPIACSDTGDIFCLVLSKNQYSSVVFWDATNEKDKNSLDNIYEIADSFSRFLELLFED